MRKIKFQYSTYDLDFNQPFVTSKNIYNSRKGFLILLTDEAGRRAFGEAAPLPEFGSETYEQTQEKLSTLKFKVKIDYSNIPGSIEDNLKEFDDLPALKHGFEQALLKLIGVQKNISLNEIVNRESRKEIPVNAAVGYLSPSETLKKVNELVQNGYSTIKLKGGRDKFSEDLDRVRFLHHEFGDRIKLRIDLNGKWDLPEAVNHLKRLEPYNLEYAEEPVSGFGKMSELAKQTSVPVAPDESIRNFKDAAAFIDSKICTFVILKPMMIGGLLPTLRIIDYAEKNNVKPVITTSLDTAIGRAFAVFAASTITHNYAHGLGTGMFFKNDVTNDPYPVKGGRISLGN